MDFIVLGFLAIGVIGFMFFKAKLALTDAGTPKFGFPATGQAAAGGRGNIHDRSGSGSIFSLFLTFGFILLVLYFLVRTGHDPNGVTDYVFEEVLHNKTYEESIPDHYNPFNEDEGEMTVKNPALRIASSTLQPEGLRPLPESAVGDIDFDELAREKTANIPPLTQRARKMLPRGDTRASTIPPGFDSAFRKVPAGGDYWLQIVATSSESRASKVASNYQGLDGLEARVVPEKGLYKVRIGPFEDRSSALATRSKFKKDWFIVAD